MAKKLYVGGLPYSFKDNDLSDLFAQVGPVASATIIMDKLAPGKSRGFGFVEMENDDDAQKAIESLNGQEVSGRKIIVNEARPMEEKPRRDFNRGGGYGDRRY